MICDMRHMTCYMWQVTHDKGHMTWDMLWGVNILSKFQLSSPNCLWFMILWRFWGKGSRTKSINNKAVCRTAMATLGLLIMFLKSPKMGLNLPGKDSKLYIYFLKLSFNSIYHKKRAMKTINWQTMTCFHTVHWGRAVA